ncbi:unnamed protein product [Ilex paraguariensis]|uniref:FHA domain-containing protein n=1 Tax=Ilex paraguariensis TaxID=185542 RepID=A0ABC8V0K6_9AQUA
MKSSDSIHQKNNKRNRFNHFFNPSVLPRKKPRLSILNTASIHIKPLEIPLVSTLTNSSCELIVLIPYKPCTIGRKRRRCEFVFDDRRVSNQHFQLFFDADNRKIYVSDGIFFLRRSGSSTRVRSSLNGVFVNGVRIGKGKVMELGAGDEVSLVCGIEGVCNIGIRIGFFLERVVFVEEVVGRNLFMHRGNGASSDYAIARAECDGIVEKANSLLTQCRMILSSDDPMLYIRNCFVVYREMSIKHTSRNRVNCNSSLTPRNVDKVLMHTAPELTCNALACRDELLPSEMVTAQNLGTKCLSSVLFHRKNAAASEVNPVTERCNVNNLHIQQTDNAGVPSEIGIANHKSKAVSLGSFDVKHVTQSDKDVHDKSRGAFVQPPGSKFHLNQLQFMGHGSSEHHTAVSLPELLYPVERLLRVFIATFTSDIPWFLSYCEVPAHLPVTIACHNAERCWSISPEKRTSVPFSYFPNLVLVYPPFPEVIAFGKDRKRLGIACHHPKLLVLQKEDSIRVVITSANLVARQVSPRMQQSHVVQLLGSVEASVVGLGHLFRPSADSNGAQLKKLAAFLGKCHGNAYGMLEIILRRNTNIPADVNAVSILIPNPEEFTEGDCVQLGFLPKNVAKWVAPLSDIGLFAFSAYIYPREVLATTVEGSNNKVRLILYVSQGPNFSDLSAIMQTEHVSALCSLVASIRRCSGLWRLQEVLGHYKWPEHLETDFVYGSSSIGSVSAPFLAAFSAAAGKRSLQFSESEESDPDWGCWSASQELRNPSIGIIYPTIERVKMASSGILASRRLLCFSQKTWQKVRNIGILHDAIPYPYDRVGYPMHVKVARRRFQSKTDASSFGWAYCGSHNFSAAAWGRPLSDSLETKANGAVRLNSVLGSRLHICNYELGIVFIVPPSDRKGCPKPKNTNLDDIVLPFVMPAPKYRPTDRPATAQAMREAVAELTKQEMEKYLTAADAGELMEDEITEEEEEVLETTNYVVEEKEEDKAYAETLWSQVDSYQSC